MNSKILYKIIGYFFFLIFVLPITYSAAAIIDVPSDYISIQQAIDAAGNGDIILVQKGTYIENINFKGKSIILESISGSQLTIIDGTNQNIITFNSNEGNDSIVRGFSLINGNKGIYSDRSSPTITNCIIQNNTVGIYNRAVSGNSSPLIAMIIQ